MLHRCLSDIVQCFFGALVNTSCIAVDMVTGNTTVDNETCGINHESGHVGWMVGLNLNVVAQDLATLAGVGLAHIEGVVLELANLCGIGYLLGAGEGFCLLGGGWLHVRESYSILFATELDDV